MSDYIKLRLVHATRNVEFNFDFSSLTKQIVDGEMVATNCEIQVNGEWTPLPQLTHAPWLDVLCRRAVESIQHNKPEQCEYFAKKAIRYGGNDNRKEPIRIAKFLLGSLQMSIQREDLAIDLLQAATYGPSAIAAAAHHNLGVSLARLRNPDGAVEQLNLSRSTDPTFFPADLSLRSLAATMLDERASNLTGQPTWLAILAGARERLSQVRHVDVDALLDSRGRFPTFQMIHVFRRVRYFPTISSKLPPEDIKLPAARSLMQQAQKALITGNDDQAYSLAVRASRLSSAVRAGAESLAATAKRRIEQAQSLAAAEQYIQAQSEYSFELDCMSIDRLDGPREALALLDPLGTDEDRKYAQQRFDNRCLQVIYEQLSSTSDRQERNRLLRIIQQYATPTMKSAFERALAISQTQEYMNAFRAATHEGQLDAAAVALQTADRWKTEQVSEARVLLELLIKDQQLAQLQVSPSACQAVRRISAAIEQGEFEQAHQLLLSLMTSELYGAPLIRLNNLIRSVELVRHAKQCLEQKDLAGARIALKDALSHRPNHLPALALMLSIDISTANLVGHNVKSATDLGRTMIESVIADDHESLAVTCRQYSTLIPNSALVECCTNLDVISAD